MADEKEITILGAGSYIDSHGRVQRWVAAGIQLVDTSALPQASLGNPYTATLTASGGQPPYTWDITADLGCPHSMLPPGLSLNPVTGIISGVPTQTGSFALKARAFDSADPPYGSAVVLTINVEES